MKWLLFCSVATVSLIAEETSHEKPPGAVATASLGDKTIFSIDPKGRAADWAQIFDLLRKDKPTLKIQVRTASGGTFLNVAEITPAANGTLLFLRIPSNQGSKLQAVPVDEIIEVGYSP
jgi:hypothetical protein